MERIEFLLFIINFGVKGVRCEEADLMKEGENTNSNCHALAAHFIRPT